MLVFSRLFHVYKGFSTCQEWTIYGKINDRFEQNPVDGGRPIHTSKK